jgi:hypothetical protein
MVVEIVIYQFETRFWIIKANYNSFKNATFFSFPQLFSSGRGQKWDFRPYFDLKLWSQLRNLLVLVVSVAFSRSSISNFQIFGQPGSLQRSKTSYGPICNLQKHVFINTNNAKGFLLQQRKVHGCVSPYKSHLQKKKQFSRP